MNSGIQQSHPTEHETQQPANACQTQCTNDSEKMVADVVKVAQEKATLENAGQENAAQENAAKEKAAKEKAAAARAARSRHISISTRGGQYSNEPFMGFDT